MQASGLPAAQCIMALQCITGNLDVPGGCIFCPNPYSVNLANVVLAEYVDQAVKEKTIGHDKYPILKHGVSFPNLDIVVEQLNTQEPYPLKDWTLADRSIRKVAVRFYSRSYCAMQPLCQQDKEWKIASMRA